MIVTSRPTLRLVAALACGLLLASACATSDDADRTRAALDDVRATLAGRDDLVDVTVEMGETTGVAVPSVVELSFFSEATTREDLLAQGWSAARVVWESRVPTIGHISLMAFPDQEDVTDASGEPVEVIEVLESGDLEERFGPRPTR